MTGHAARSLLATALINPASMEGHDVNVIPPEPQAQGRSKNLPFVVAALIIVVAGAAIFFFSPLKEYFLNSGQLLNVIPNNTQFIIAIPGGDMGQESHTLLTPLFPLLQDDTASALALENTKERFIIGFPGESGGGGNVVYGLVFPIGDDVRVEWLTLQKQFSRQLFVKNSYALVTSRPLTETAQTALRTSCVEDRGCAFTATQIHEAEGSDELMAFVKSDAFAALMAPIIPAELPKTSSAHEALTLTLTALDEHASEQDEVADMLVPPGAVGSFPASWKILEEKNFPPFQLFAPILPKLSPESQVVYATLQKIPGRFTLMSDKSVHLFELEQSTIKPAEFELLFSEALGRSFPKNIKTRLPDGTTLTQTVLSSDLYPFSGTSGVRTMELPSGDGVVGYIFNNSRLSVSNSPELLRTLRLAQTGASKQGSFLNISTTASQCFGQDVSLSEVMYLGANSFIADPRASSQADPFHVLLFENLRDKKLLLREHGDVVNVCVVGG